MRRRGSWPGISDPIRQAIIDVESNAAEATSALERTSRRAWRVVEAGATIQAQVWDLVVAVTPSCVVLFPAAGPLNAGCEIAVSREASCTTGVTIQPMSGTVDGAAASTPGPAVNRIWVLISNGKQWVSVD